MPGETGPRPRFWWSDDVGPPGAVARAALRPFAVLFAAATRARARAYAEGRRRTFRPPAPCVSVGNLVVGGSGKTPCVRRFAEWLKADGRRPVVLSRGYGAKTSSGLDEEGASLVAAVPGLEVDQRPGRREGRGDWADVAADPRVTLILDDGFQKLVCARDLDVVLLDAARPFGNGDVLPAGPLREPREALGRADAVVLTRCDQAPPAAAEATRRQACALAPRALVLRARHAPATLLRSGAAATALRGRRVHLLSAVARPDAFAATVRGLGAVVTGETARRDHAPLGPAALAAARAAARVEGADIVLCTSKDLPKLPADDAGAPPLDALDVVFEFLDDPAPLRERLRALVAGEGRA